MSAVIINGDDYGLNEHCSRAIAEAFERRLISDATMMATGEYFDEAVALAAEKGFADRIGIHLNLTEGEPLTRGIKNCPHFVTRGRFNKNCDPALSLSAEESEAIYLELSAQVRRMEEAGIVINHADSHHHAHTFRHIYPIALRVCREHGIMKLRLLRSRPGELNTEAEEFKKRLREAGFITAESFIYAAEYLDRELPDGAEILVHPDYDRDGALIDRRGVEDGYPVGYPLPDLAKSGGAALISYNEL